MCTLNSHQTTYLACARTCSDCRGQAAVGCGGVAAAADARRPPKPQRPRPQPPFGQSCKRPTSVGLGRRQRPSSSAGDVSTRPRDDRKLIAHVAVVVVVAGLWQSMMLRRVFDMQRDVDVAPTTKTRSTFPLCGGAVAADDADAAVVVVPVAAAAAADSSCCLL